MRKTNIFLLSLFIIVATSLNVSFSSSSYAQEKSESLLKAEKAVETAKEEVNRKRFVKKFNPTLQTENDYAAAEEALRKAKDLLQAEEAVHTAQEDLNDKIRLESLSQKLRRVSPETALKEKAQAQANLEKAIATRDALLKPIPSSPSSEGGSSLGSFESHIASTQPLGRRESGSSRGSLDSPVTAVDAAQECVAALAHLNPPTAECAPPPASPPNLCTTRGSNVFHLTPKDKTIEVLGTQEAIVDKIFGSQKCIQIVQGADTCSWEECECGSTPSCHAYWKTNYLEDYTLKRIITAVITGKDLESSPPLSLPTKRAYPSKLMEIANMEGNKDVTIGPALEQMKKKMLPIEDFLKQFVRHTGHENPASQEKSLIVLCNGVKHLLSQGPNTTLKDFVRPYTEGKPYAFGPPFATLENHCEGAQGIVHRVLNPQAAASAVRRKNFIQRLKSRDTIREPLPPSKPLPPEKEKKMIQRLQGEPVSESDDDL